MKNKLSLLVVALGIWSFLLASCSSSPGDPSVSSCADIVDDQITKISLDGFDKNSIGSWIRRNYSEGQLLDVDKGPGYYWKYKERNYGAYFDENKSVIQYDLKPLPKISDVLRCYGTPDYYRIDSGIGGPETGGIEFSIWYLKKGYVFKYVGFGKQTITVFTPFSLLNTISIVPPGNIDEMAKMIYASSQKSKVVSEIKPWPPNFDHVTLDR